MPKAAVVELELSTPPQYLSGLRSSNQIALFPSSMAGGEVLVTGLLYFPQSRTNTVLRRGPCERASAFLLRCLR